MLRLAAQAHQADRFRRVDYSIQYAFWLVINRDRIAVRQEERLGFTGRDIVILPPQFPPEQTQNFANLLQRNGNT